MIARPRRRRRAAAGAKPLLGSLAIHGTALALAWGATHTSPPPIDFVSFQIDLVSAPAAADLGSPVVEAPRDAPQPAAAEPTPQPPAPDNKVETPAPPKPKPEPAKPTPKPATPAPTTNTKPAASTPKPTASGPTTDKATGSESAESINIRMQGLRRDYPAYYDNIIRQIGRCFRWTGSEALETELYFVIEKNGRVTDADFVRQSPNQSFNYEAMGAVECAGQPGRFGPLPDDFPFDRLPVRFTFRPGNAGIFR